MERRSSILVSAALTATCILALAPGAEAASGLRAEIPFDFSVRGHVLPAGVYDVRVTDRGLLQLRGAEGDAAAAFTVSTGENTVVRDGRLVFLVAGGDRALVEVWQPGHGAGRELLPAFRVRTYTHGDRIAIALRPASDVRPG